MKIEQAKSLKRGDTVAYPADRGSPAGTGKVESIGTEVHKTIAGNEYIWVTVRLFGHNAAWPSNRLS